MKIKILNYIVYGLITLTLANCGNKSESKTDSGIETETELKSNFVYTESDKKVELILENNAEFLVLGKPTKAKFITENINDQRFAIFGTGLMINKQDTEFRFIITPIEKNLVNGKLEIQVKESAENGKNFNHKFLIPVKSSTD